MDDGLQLEFTFRDGRKKAKTINVRNVHVPSLETLTDAVDALIPLPYRMNYDRDGVAEFDEDEY